MAPHSSHGRRQPGQRGSAARTDHHPTHHRVEGWVDLCTKFPTGAPPKIFRQKLRGGFLSRNRDQFTKRAKLLFHGCSTGFLIVVDTLTVCPQLVRNYRYPLILNDLEVCI